jgi:deazaflavin-dependent oxidoreductase (nitroreductase family)
VQERWDARPIDQVSPSEIRTFVAEVKADMVGSRSSATSTRKLGTTLGPSTDQQEPGGEDDRSPTADHRARGKAGGPVTVRSRPVGLRPGWLVRLAFRLPRALFNLRLGGVFGGHLVLVEHTGRRTGKRYRTPLEVVGRDPSGALTVVSAFGGHADWYRNLLAQPDTRVIIRGRVVPAAAEAITVSEGSAVMLRYARRHRRLARRILGLLGYDIDGTDADFLEVGSRLRFLRLVPAPGFRDWSHGSGRVG